MKNPTANSTATSPVQKDSQDRSNLQGKAIYGHHWDDWIASSVDPDLIRANILSLDHNTPYEYLCYSEKIDRNASGRINLATIKLYDHTTHGGWWCSGADPFENWKPMQWGCFKPDRPRIAGEKKKLIKYEHPYKTGRRAFFLNVPWTLAWAIAQRVGGTEETRLLERTVLERKTPMEGPLGGEIDLREAKWLCPSEKRSEEPLLEESCSDPQSAFRSIFSLPPGSHDRRIAPNAGDSWPDRESDRRIAEPFWKWVAANPQVPVMLTEGAKKAGCLLSCGYAAIALPGIYGGYSTLSSASSAGIQHALIPELNCIATPGRRVVICFDNDSKPTTIRNVQTATRTLGNLLQARGAQVQVMTWTGESEKGIDDLVMAQGVHALHHLYDSALPLRTWNYKVQQENVLTIEPTLRLNVSELQQSMIPNLPRQGLFVLASGKGTGKTNLLSEILRDEPKVISLGHRIALQRNTCDRWGLKFKNDLDKFRGRFCGADGYASRMGLCIDSILSIRPEDVMGGVLVLDEFMQVLRHLFVGGTCAHKGNRGALIEHFNQLVSIARWVILADADATDAGINYVRQWRSDGDHSLVLVQNDYVGPNFDATFLETRKLNDVYHRLTEDIQAQNRVFIAIDSREASKKLCQSLQDKFPKLRGLLINSETSGERAQRTFITNPNAGDQHYDWIIATPSLGTGVSIEADRFDLVYGLFNGVLTDGDAAQALSRVRAKVPRIIWVSHQGKNQSLISQSSNTRVIRRALRKRNSTAAKILRSQLGYRLAPLEREDDLSHQDPIADFYCELVAQDNASHNALSDALKVRLKMEGSQLSEIIPECHSAEFALAMRDISRTIKRDDAEAIATARELTSSELQILKSQPILSQSDRQAIEKRSAQAFFCKTELTADDVIFYGKYSEPIRQLESLLYDCALSGVRDQAEIDRQLQWGSLLIPWDLRGHSVKRFIRDRIGLVEFLSLNKCWTSREIQQFADHLRHCRKDVKLYLNLTIQETSNNNWILSQLLGQLGLKTKSRQQGRRGEQETVYSLEDEHFSIVAEILQRRQECRLAMADSHTGGLDSSDKGLVENPPFLYSQEECPYEATLSLIQNERFQTETKFSWAKRFRRWVFEQVSTVREFFYPDVHREMTRITPT